GVFVRTEEVTVGKGQSVTLHTGALENYHQIIWRDTMQIDNQTGSLTISNISTEHAGLYKLQIINKFKKSAQKEFNVSVPAPLPIPKIIKDSERSSCSKCVLQCSVIDVRQATLSWYEGNLLISSIPVSGLNSSSFLLLELNDQDINNYSCVVNSSISNQTEQLNINELCPPCSGMQQLQQRKYDYC
ncbi:hypothetical protein PO909_026973, partial [Leuciscus waleckii]